MKAQKQRVLICLDYKYDIFQKRLILSNPKVLLLSLELP